jgi:malate dehydrogenase (oxaloacetate-decarboxylating)(NADP+)
LRALGVEDPGSFEVMNSRTHSRVGEMVERLYARLHRRGYLHREVERMVNQDRNTFAALLLALGEGDVLITGVTRPYAQSLRQIQRVLDAKEGATPFGVHILVGRAHTTFMADTTVTERPTAEQLAEIAIQTAAVARRMGHVPRVAFLSYSNFGDPQGTFLDNVRGAVRLLDGREVDFEYEGEMAPDVALNPALQRVYPFSRLTGPANVLVMPGLQSANLSAKLLGELGGDAVIGPMMLGMAQPVQIATMTASASDLVTLAVLAAGGIVR